MKNWEDIIKDRLEGYESPLPESSLAEFRALRDEKAVPPAKKISPWLRGFAVAVAAGLAAVLFLRQPAAPDNGIQIIQQPTATLAAAMDSTEAFEPIPTTLIAQAVAPKTVRQVSIRTREVIRKDQPAEDAPIVVSEGEGNDLVTTDEVQAESGTEETKDAPAVTPASPFIPERTGVKTRTVQVGPAAGVVAGSGLLAALVTPALRAGTLENHLPAYVQDMAGKPNTTSEWEHSSLDQTGIGTSLPDEVITGSPKHYFPLKLGLSTRIPVAGQLHAVTGLQYSLYSSSYTRSLSGELKQQAHYLGIPVRMDWVFASGRMLDVYVGGGVLGEICLDATLDGNSLPKDGPGFSLLGAGGIQMNMTKHLGLYVEPELSWRIPSEKHVLQTYRSEHPLMFSVAAGLRINLGR